MTQVPQTFGEGQFSAAQGVDFIKPRLGRYLTDQRAGGSGSTVLCLDGGNGDSVGNVVDGAASAEIVARLVQGLEHRHQSAGASLKLGGLMALVKC